MSDQATLPELSAPAARPLDISVRRGSRKALKESSMLTALTINGWRGTKKDAKVTEEVAVIHHVDKAAGAYWKRLVDKKAVNPIQAAAQNARGIHYKYSLPWDESGDRILPSALFAKYREELENAKDRWEKAVAEFLETYTSHIEDARVALNGLFNERDYPSVQAMGAKFKWSLQIKPLPDADDFRVSISDDEKSRIREELESHQRETLVKATKDIWSRLQEVIARFVEAMASQKDRQVFHSTIIGNIADICDLVGDLNLSGDPALDRISQKIKAELCSVPVDDYRGKDEAAVILRKEGVAKAEAILEIVNSYI